MNLARFLSRRQVAESSAREPLDAVTVQPVTLPVGWTSSTTLVLPCALKASASAG
jgi:hypothetical protein